MQHKDFATQLAETHGLARARVLELEKVAGLADQSFYRGVEFNPAARRRLWSDVCATEAKKNFGAGTHEKALRIALRGGKAPVGRLVNRYKKVLEFHESKKLLAPAFLGLLKRYVGGKAGKRGFHLQLAFRERLTDNRLHPEADYYIFLKRREEILATCGLHFWAGGSVTIENLQGEEEHPELSETGYRKLLARSAEQLAREMKLQKIGLRAGGKHIFSGRARAHGVDLKKRLDQTAIELGWKPDNKYAPEYYERNLRKRG